MKKKMQYLRNFSEEMKALFPRGEIFNSCIQIDNVLSELEQNEEIENNIREALLYEHDEDTLEEPYKEIAEMDLIRLTSDCPST